MREIKISIQYDVLRPTCAVATTRGDTRSGKSRGKDSEKIVQENSRDPNNYATATNAAHIRSPIERSSGQTNATDSTAPK